MTAFGCRGNRDTIGVLIAQLGTPDEPTPSALRRYLKQFLSDPRVIETNRALWWLILNGLVLRTRPKRSARLYRRIWRDEGSPLLLITRAQTEKAREQLARLDANVEVAFGMRYGSPSIEQAIDDLMQRGVSRVLLFPMYPQYCAATTGSTYDAVFAHLLKRRWVPTLRVAEPYYAHPRFITAVADGIKSVYARATRRPERLVLSYHGIPEKYVAKGDPYCCMCSETTAALLPALGLPEGEVIHTYQSRFGRDPWLVPYTDQTIEGLAKEGVKHIAVACPGFTADCLETLDELGNEGSALFKKHGGETLTLIPCVNDDPVWIGAMCEIITGELSTWLSPGANAGCAPSKAGDFECPVARSKASSR